MMDGPSDQRDARESNGLFSPPFRLSLSKPRMTTYEKLVLIKLGPVFNQHVFYSNKETTYLLNPNSYQALNF